MDHYTYNRSRSHFQALPMAVCCPITDHVIFSKELLFYQSKLYLFICTRQFENLNGRFLKKIITWSEMGQTNRPVENGLLTPYILRQPERI